MDPQSGITPASIFEWEQQLIGTKRKAQSGFAQQQKSFNLSLISCCSLSKMDMVRAVQLKCQLFYCTSQKPMFNCQQIISLESYMTTSCQTTNSTHPRLLLCQLYTMSCHLSLSLQNY